MNRLLLAAVLGLASLAAVQAQAAAYLDPVQWLNAAQPGSRMVTMPGQSVVLRDGFGSYTNEQSHDPVLVGVQGGGYDDPDYSLDWGRFTVADGENSVGRLSGNFGCLSPVGPSCLGATTITYTLPQKVWGFAGSLDFRFSFGGAGDIPFFGIDPIYLNYNNDPDEPYLRFSYQGFFGVTFDTPTDTFEIGWRPGGAVDGQGTDNSSSFRMTDVVALVPGRGRPVPVPEPVSFAIFGMALLGLAVAKRCCEAARSRALQTVPAPATRHGA